MGESTGCEGSTGAKKRILVAEDDAIVRSWLSKTLLHEGYEVLEAVDGLAAADALATQAVDLVLTDLWMPRMNGVELIEALGHVDWRLSGGRVPEVVVLSAHLTGSSTGKLTGLGVFRTLTKPVESSELLAVVRAALASNRRQRLSAPAPASLPAAPAAAARGMVLVADDDEGIRALLCKALGERGYEVVTAVDGEDAVEKALAHDIDLILMDLNMPRMNGLQAVVNLKRATRDCFIICMTGECSQREIDRVLQAGVMSAIRKPFDILELLAEVDRLDLIASHRRKLAERERARAEAEKNWSLADSTRTWISEQKHRYGNRLTLVLVLATLVVMAAAVAVPIISSFTRQAAEKAKAVTERIGNAADAATRVEGYLQRDEARELDRTR